MKKAAYSFLILAVLTILSGCGNYTLSSTPSAPNTVIRVTVTYSSTQEHFHREYVSSNKMRAVLNYLRWVDPYGKPETDPDTARGGLFRIILHLSDGTQTVYLQRSDQFMQVNGGPWLTIDPDRAKTLHQIVAEMESDSISSP